MSKVVSIDKELDLSYQGRNGYGHLRGLLVSVWRRSTDAAPYIAVQPINSKDMVGNCSIEIPALQAEEFIQAIRDVLKEYDANLAAAKAPPVIEEA